MMIGFIGLFDKARDYTLQFTVTHTHTRTHTSTPVSTVTSSLPLLGSDSQRRTFPEGCACDVCDRPRLPFPWLGSLVDYSPTAPAGPSTCTTIIFTEGCKHNRSLKVAVQVLVLWPTLIHTYIQRAVLVTSVIGVIFHPCPLIAAELLLSCVLRRCYLATAVV
jgi:hypothetical protein